MENKPLLQEYKDTYNQYIKTSELLDKEFQFYLTIHEELYEKIFMQADAANKNISFEEIKEQIFRVDFCEEKKLEAIKNSFLKNYFEIEEIKKKNNSLGLFDELACVCQLINKIVQKHWEFFQYKKDKIILADILQLFLKEVNEAMLLWDSFIHKLEVFSRLFVSSQQSNQDKKSTQVFFQKNSNSGANLKSIKNFINLLEEINDLIYTLEKEPLKPLQMNSSQVHSDQVGLELLLPPKYSLALETIVQSLHPDMLAKDGLLKLLLQIFSADKLRALDKKIIQKYQKKFKDLINAIDRVGNFGVEQLSHTGMFQKLSNLLKKFDTINYNADGSRNTSRKIRYQFIHAVNNQKNQKNSEGKSEEPENKDHLAYLTSS